jgi:SAM-dependent methyltransferase
MLLNNSFHWSVCPLCKSSSLESIGNINYRQPVMFSTHKVSLEKQPLLFKCGSCNSWVTQNIVPEVIAMKLYLTGESDVKWPRLTKFSEMKSQNIINRLNQYFISEKKIIDIGCNTGLLLDYARTMGCITTGVEPSKTSQDVLNKKGHPFFDSISAVSGKYDVVTAFDLVEHLYDLPTFIDTVSNLLAKNGVFILLTGNVNSLSARLASRHWWYLKAPEHIVFPSIKYFQSLVNFEVVSVDQTYASKGYKRSFLFGIAQYIRKTLLHGGYDGLSSLGPDHMLVVMRKI